MIHPLRGYRRRHENKIIREAPWKFSLRLRIFRRVVALKKKEMKERLRKRRIGSSGFAQSIGAEIRSNSRRASEACRDVTGMRCNSVLYSTINMSRKDGRGWQREESTNIACYMKKKSRNKNIFIQRKRCLRRLWLFANNVLRLRVFIIENKTTISLVSF